MSNVYADPLFVKAEVEYRLERHGLGREHRTASWPDLSGRLRRRLTTRRHPGTRSAWAPLARRLRHP